MKKNTTMLSVMNNLRVTNSHLNDAPTGRLGLKKVFVVMMLCLGLFATKSFATNYYCTGDPSTIGNWYTGFAANAVTGTQQSSTAIFTTAGNTFYLFGTSATMGANLTISGAGSFFVIGDSLQTTFSGGSTALTINNGFTLTIGSSAKLYVTANSASIYGSLTLSTTGALAISSSNVYIAGTLTNNNATAISGATASTIAFYGTKSNYIHACAAGTVPLSAWGVGSTVQITGATGAVPTNVSQNFYNLTWNCAGQTSALAPQWQNKQFGGNLTILNTNSQAIRLINPTASVASVITIGGNFTINGTTAAVYGNGSGTKGYLIINVGGNLNLLNGLYKLNGGSGATSCVINLTGNGSSFTNTSSVANGLSSNAAGDSCAIVFAGSGIQSYTNTGNTSNTLTNFRLSVNSGATLNIGNNTIAAPFIFNLNSGATLQTSNTLGINANITTSGAVNLSPTANYIFNGSSAQVTGAMLTSASNLTVNNSTGVTLSGATSLSGTLTLTSGALSQGAFALTLGNSASINRSGGTIATAPTFGTAVNVTYAQNGTAITTGAELPTSSSVLNNLIVNSSNGVVLGSSATVNGTMTLTSGNLSLDNNNLILNASNVVAGTPGTSNHIVTASSGYVTTAATFNTAYTFPVGFDATNYNPVTITPSAEIPTVQAKSISPSMSNSLKAMWVIGGLTSSSTNLAFPWKTTNDATGIAPISGILFNYSGSEWNGIPASSTSGSSTSYTTSYPSASISNPSTFAIGPNVAPTISLTSDAGTTSQSVNTITPINTITYDWGGAATGASVTWTGTADANMPPTGITVNTTGSVTISGTASVAGNYGYTVTSVGGSPAATLTGTFVVEAVANVSLSAISAISSGNILSGSTGNFIANFAVSVTSASTTITGFSLPITTGGGLVSADLLNYKLYYTTSNTFNTSNLLGTVSASLASTPISFTGFSKTINSGVTGYFWITTDVAVSATSTHTIASNAISYSNLTYSVNVSGSGTVDASGTQIIVYPTYYNVANSDVSQLSNWGTNSNGTGTHPSNFSNPNVIYNLYNGTSGNTLSTSTTFTGSGSILNIGDGTTATRFTIGTTLTIGSASTLVVNANAVLTINGYLLNSGILNSITASTNFIVNGTYEDNSTDSLPVATWNTGSTTVVSGSTTAIPGNNSQSFYNYTWNCASQSGTIALNWSGKTIPGSFTVNNTGGQQLRFYSITAGVASTITIGQDLIVNGASALLTTNGSSGKGYSIINVGRDFKVLAGSFIFNSGGGHTSCLINLTGNFNNAATISSNAAADSAAIVFNGVTAQTYTNTGSLTIISAPILTVASGATLNIGTNTIGTAWVFNLNAGATLQTTSTSGINGNILSTTKTLDPAANYIFSGSSAQVTGALLTNAASLTINNSAGVTISGSTSVSGTVYLTSGSLANASALTLGNSATISRSAGTIASAPTFGSAVNVAYTQNGSSITTGAEIPTTASVLNNLTINTSNGVALGSNASVNGTLTLTSGQLTLGSNNLALSASHSVAGTPSASKHIITDGVGYVTSTAAFSTAYTYPVGYNASVYNPVIITPSAEIPTVKVAAISPALTNSLKAMWTIGGVTANSSVISFPWVSTTDAVATAQKAGMVYSLIAASWGTALDNSSTAGSNPNYTTTLNNTDIISPSTFTVGPPSAATLALTSDPGTDAQSVNTTTAITDITYEFSGSATTASVSWTGTSNSSTAPTGITVDLDLVNNVVTISGTASVAGTYGYTVLTDGSPTASKSGTITVASTANVVIATSTTVSSGNIFPGSSDNQLINFSVAASGNSATLTSIRLPITAGLGLTASELVNYKLYYTSTNTFSSATLLSTVSTALVTSPITFSLSRTIVSGTTGYFWITTDVSNSATIGHTLTANSITSSNLTFALNANISGTVSSGGTQTISYPTYYNISNSDISILSSWGDNTDGTGMHPSNFAGAHTTFYLVNGTANRMGTSTAFSGAGTILVIGDSSRNAGLTVSSTTLTIGTATASTGSLVIAPKGTLTVGSAANCTVLAGGSFNNSNTNATLNVNGYFKNSGSFTNLGTLNVSGSGSTFEHNINGGTIPLATWGTGSTLLVSGIVGTGPTMSGSSFYNVTWNCPSQTTASAGPIFNNSHIFGNLTIASTGTGVLRFLGMTAGAPNTITIDGNLSISGSSIVHTNGSGSKGYAIYNVGGNFTVGSGSAYYFNKGSGASSCTINMLNGNFSNAGTISSNVPATDSIAIVFKKNGSQTFTNTATNTSSAGIVTTLGKTVLTVNSGTTLTIAASSVPGLTINSGGAVSLSSSLSVLNAFTNNSNIAGTIVLGGTTAQSVAGIGSVTNLTVNNSAGATVTAGSNLQSITGVLTLQSGQLTTNGNITLKSTSITNTAVVAPVGVSGNTGTISGTVTVERFIPSGSRTYRDLGPEVANAGSIYSNWQENGTSNNGYGIQITGKQGGTVGTDPVTGFDYSLTGNHSLFTYTNNTWDSVLSTKANNLNPYQGYRVLVRGDRTGNLQQQLQFNTAATIRAKGNLVTGTVTLNTTNALTSGANSYSFIANPYVSPVSWSAVVSASTGINNSYWYNDPTFTNNGYTVFVAYNPSSGASNTFSKSVVNAYLQPGQAFFVQNSTASPSLVFSESSKDISQGKTAIFGATTVNRISAGLFKNGTNVDGAVTAFGSNFSSSLGNEDAIKFPNGGENLAFTIGAKDVCINGTVLPSTSDVFPIHLYNLSASTSYSIRLDVSQFSANGLQAYLKDNVLNTKTLLSGNNTSISFMTASSDAAKFANRYSVVFGNNTLPVSDIKLSAISQAGAVQVNWSVVGESNVASYVVEHSLDGASFLNVASVQANNGSIYSVTDTKAVTGTNYYRIKVVSNNGTVSYSNVATVNVGNDVASIAVYPNPLVGSKLNVSINHLEAGKYTITVYDVLGAKVVEKSITHVGGSTSEQLSINSHLATGAYTVRVSNSNGVSYQSKIEVK